MTKKQLLLLAVPLLCAWSLAWGLAPAPAPPAAEAHVAAVGSPPTFRFQGAGSCAAAACHNGQGAPGALGSEYTTWAAQPRETLPSDKHSYAYEALHTRSAQLMSRNLGRAKPAHQDSLCLNCHVLPDHDLVAGKDLLPENFLRDGVSCESCHGPAEKWLVEHYRPGWREKTSAEKAALGMRETRQLTARAKLCVQCHLGSLPAAEGGLGQDVYHDLYAAGHPPLIFEFGAYHSTALRHWQDAKDKDPRFGGTPDFEGRAWIVGQVVSAQSALDLLAWRASEKTRPWPEFAEMDCFACHHELKDPSPRREAGFKGKPGSVPVREWYYHMLPRSLEAIEVGGDPAVVDGLAELRKQMAKVVPDRAEVATRARDLSKRLEKWSARCEKLPPPDLDRLYKAIREKDVPRAKEGWDQAAQVYLSLAALQNTWSDTRSETNLPAETLDAVRQELRFPRGGWSPTRYDPLSVWKNLVRLTK